MKLHQRGHVGKAHVVGARGHAVDRGTGAVARVDGHVQARILVIALGCRLQEQGRRAFKAPVELEFDGFVLRLGGAQSGQGHSGNGGLEEMAFEHAVLLMRQG